MQQCCFARYCSGEDSYRTDPFAMLFSHRDQDRHAPLSDALQCGCSSIEMDVYYHAGQSCFVLAHDRSRIESALAEARTLEHSYFDPLWRLYRQNALKHQVRLYVDLKSGGADAYELVRCLAPYQEMLCTYDNVTGREKNGLVKVVLTGCRGVWRERLKSSERPACTPLFVDGRLGDTLTGSIGDLTPLVSSEYKVSFPGQWRD